MPPLLGGSGVVIGRVISPVIWVITLLITTHERPSTATKEQEEEVFWLLLSDIPVGSGYRKVGFKVGTDASRVYQGVIRV